MQTSYQGEHIRTIAMKLVMEKTVGKNVTAEGKWLRSRCQVKPYIITDPSYMSFLLSALTALT